jgi:hypothetical protein
MTWQDRSACAGRLEFGQDPDADKAVCATCPVRAECYAWAEAETGFEGVAGGTEWKGRRGAGRTKARLYGDWTAATRREAHAAYTAGLRTDWAREGQRAYRAHRKCELRAQHKAEAA